MDSKQSYEKHIKYLNFYETLKVADDEYWGIGIENETYLMFENMTTVPRKFIEKNQKPERYSVNYWRNYKGSELASTLKKLPDNIHVPIYINSYLFRNADLLGEHATLYLKGTPPNRKYSDESIDEYLRRVSPVFKQLFKNNMIYDGDTFEFTTFDFYKATTIKAINELKIIKASFLNEINKRLVSKFTMFKEPLIYPPFNYGFAKFASNPNNIAICNNGTYHINITLPTKLGPNGQIKNPDEFKAIHANAIRAIQWIEPLLVALYGSPDILHMIDSKYPGGSQRLGFSRYVGLGTYDSHIMEKGKLLDSFKYKGTECYFNELHADSPYNPPETIGYDFNYNKFTKHGIELRIFDYFPEKYLEPIINLLILVCQHSMLKTIPDPRTDSAWNHLCVKVIRKGSISKIKSVVRAKLFSVFDVKNYWFPTYWYPFNMSILSVANTISSSLYTAYKDGDVCAKMSPNMNPVILVDYNGEVKREFSKMVLFK
jgi:hypothetical protein